MFRRTHLITSGLVLGWYLFAAAMGWRGWTPQLAGGMGGGRTSGGHGSVYSGGWGGGK